MRELTDARMWADHHEAFDDIVVKAIVAARSGLQRFASWDGSTHQLLALLLSFAITALTFNVTTTPTA